MTLLLIKHPDDPVPTTAPDGWSGAVMDTPGVVPGQVFYVDPSAYLVWTPDHGHWWLDRDDATGWHWEYDEQ